MIEADPIKPSLSVASAVMVWIPTERGQMSRVVRPSFTAYFVRPAMFFMFNEKEVLEGLK